MRILDPRLFARVIDCAFGLWSALPRWRTIRKKQIVVVPSACQNKCDLTDPMQVQVIKGAIYKIQPFGAVASYATPTIWTTTQQVLIRSDNPCLCGQCQVRKHAQHGEWTAAPLIIPLSIGLFFEKYILGYDLQVATLSLALASVFILQCPVPKIKPVTSSVYSKSHNATGALTQNLLFLKSNFVCSSLMYSSFNKWPMRTVMTVVCTSKWLSKQYSSLLSIFFPARNLQQTAHTIIFFSLHYLE